MYAMPTIAGSGLLLLLCMLLNAVIQPREFAVSATDDVANVSPCELESIINQLVNPNAEYQLHASALRNQLKNILRERQLAVGEEQSLGDYADYPEEDKRSVAALAAQGLLHANAKRGLATLAKNGQLPTVEPDDYSEESEELNEQKRYVGALARSGGMLNNGKRNIGTLARDFQLPNGKRNLATMARLGMLGAPTQHPKRNLAAVARYNSQQRMGAAAAEKRNLGALKGSPVHGAQQKREDEEVVLPAISPRSFDYVDYAWLYPSYADMDWGDFGRAQKRFLDTSKDPELFGIEHGTLNQAEYNVPTAVDDPYADNNYNDNNYNNNNNNNNENNNNYGYGNANDNDNGKDAANELLAPQAKRHIGAVYRSGFQPGYHLLRSTTGSDLGYGGISGVGSGRFSRSGRARQFVEYYPPHERLRQPIAAVCKRCFLPNRPIMNWSGAGIRGRLPPVTRYYGQREQQEMTTNALPTTARNRPSHGTGAQATSTTFHAWGTPPRITALHQREFRRNGPMQNFEN